ncbi:MAG: hypothetical protein KC684_05675 [Candidatus Omnitrophica bacterium]|nr:hypothetical protein [Candidatus Omnitrophota bacterium]
MIQKVDKKLVKAVGLISGGLDSTVAAKVVKDLGVDVYGVYFAMPWGCCDKTKAIEAAIAIDIKFIVLQLDERYLEMVRNPKHGYGTAMNPCVDCRIHMFSRAAQYMKHIGADFVFTGEVLGQRPMSQRRHSMKWIEEETGLKGKLLRPLCAQLMEPTIPEQEGLIDRNQLLQITGRSRKMQYEIARKLGITEFTPPAGGCLLTDKNFARRMKDTLDHGYRNFRETIALKWGRHYRIEEGFKLILGRDEEENVSLVRYAHRDDIIMEFPDKRGPTLVLKGEKPSEKILAIAAGLVQYYSKRRDLPSQELHFWKASKTNEKQTTLAKKLTDADIKAIQI